MPTGHTQRALKVVLHASRGLVASLVAREALRAEPKRAARPGRGGNPYRFWVDPPAAGPTGFAAGPTGVAAAPASAAAPAAAAVPAAAARRAEVEEEEEEEEAVVKFL